jgi:hypothetical protein
MTARCMQVAAAPLHSILACSVVRMKGSCKNGWWHQACKLAAAVACEALQGAMQHNFNGTCPGIHAWPRVTTAACASSSH